MVKIAGLASNRGRNLLHIADRMPGGAELSIVLTNQDGAPVLEGASERGIPTEVVTRKEDESRESHEQRILDTLESYDFDIVCLDGYMRVLTAAFVDNAPTTLNIHPSLLPAFPGMDAHEQVLGSGVRMTGYGPRRHRGGRCRTDRHPRGRPSLRGRRHRRPQTACPLRG